MKLTDLLKGKKVSYITDARVPVILEIESAKEVSHSRDLEAATKENDWWPASETWSTIEVKFTNGFSKTFSSLSQIDIVE